MGRFDEKVPLGIRFNFATAIIGALEYRFFDPIEVGVAYSEGEIISLLERVEKYSYDGKVVVGWVSYEACCVFDRAYPRKFSVFDGFPYAFFVVFNGYSFSPVDYECISLMGMEKHLEWEPLITKEEYVEKIGIIRENIREGNVYQVNFTFPLRAKFEGNLEGLFRRLCYAQGSGYFIFIDVPPYAVLSVSPELFFNYEGDELYVKPMKGTRPRGRWKEEDEQLMRELKTSEKERAENLMIVDLLRNDLGKISKFGRVEVPNMFTVEGYKTVWQMTSEIKCETKASLVEVFKAIFPSGSVTGAPKIYAMKLINALEKYPRGLYCGCVGVIFPGRRAIFNVAIRTMLYNYVSRDAYYYVGSGIVWDSDPEEEWEECIVKARIIKRVPKLFSLVETIRVENKKPFLLEYHLRRLEWSASRFGYPFVKEDVEREILRVCDEVDENLYRLRIELFPSGKFGFEYPLRIGSTRVKLGLARSGIDSKNELLYHKTSVRDVYMRALSTRPDCEDVLLWNEDGYITESTIANVVVVIDGVHYTPPVECGLLPGTYRQYLIDSGKIREKAIHKDMLSSAGRVYLINSVRKEIEVEWLG